MKPIIKANNLYPNILGVRSWNSSNITSIKLIPIKLPQTKLKNTSSQIYTLSGRESLLVQYTIKNVIKLHTGVIKANGIMYIKFYLRVIPFLIPVTV